MSISLYHATVPTFLQITGAVSGLLDRAEAFCAEKGLDPSELIEARLAPDMRPFAFQVRWVAMHGFGAIESVRNGGFVPDMTPPPSDFAGLRARLADAIRGLETVGYSELDAYIGKPVTITLRDGALTFDAEDYLLSFAQPNFFFHATTVYDILRWKGLEIGKRNFLGKLRFAED
ncbi:DUF1993 domain-containing protein [Rhizorhabdus dicambivorans]|uniref:DUF1993 domain-containing protein n=1 Tax=Rhizorhabdus dicambivorans TaxID=1850238 RepID=A0A2A4FQQ6_9SPHN|nr:DUF1993 domain-containing protein [Rhizorhabdus dicambivorans]ATE64790.1 DUF1993 domain-containing protein [Rhizorhabdus dicambivorans]PCE39731.1 DUF1993 domain-containing protein [Rhizorhabdus dicambivorans]